MKELSLNILDLIENSISAKATKVTLIIEETDLETSIQIIDNGVGMSEDELNSALNPFFSSKGKKFGFGLPLVKDIADLCGGKFQVESCKGKGTILKLNLSKKSIDHPPLGDIVSTITTIIALHPNIDFIYKHSINENSFTFSLDDFKTILEDVPVNHPKTLKFFEDYLKHQLILISGGK